MTVTKRFRKGFFAALCRLASAAPGAIVAACVLLAAAPAAPAGGIVLWEPCTREQAERWAADAERDGEAALRAASCYVTLVEAGRERSAGLGDARRGRAAAEAAVRKLPDSGLAHYLAAYLTGLVAERSPIRALGLVPAIEREAVRAADLDPGVDRGGPHRMLG